MLASDAGGLIVMFLFVAFFVGLVVYGMIHAKKVREAWAAFARAHGLTYNGAISATAKPHIQGWYKNVFVDISTITRGSGKNRSTYTVYHAAINAPMPAGLLVTKEGLMAKLGQLFGGTDVQVGDRELDAAFNIKARDVQGAATLMRMPLVKRAVMYLVSRQADMKWSERNITFETSGITPNAQQLAANLEDIVYMAATLDAAYAELTGTAPPSGPARGGEAGAAAVRRAASAAAQHQEQQQQAQRFDAQAAAGMAAAQVMAQAAMDRQQDEVRAAREAHERELAAARAGLDAARAAGGGRPIASDSQRRTRAENEAVGLLADAFHKLEVKMAAAGASRAEDVSTQGFARASFASAGGFSGVSSADAFAAPQGADAFAVAAAPASPARKAASPSAISADAFKLPSAGDAFKTPEAGDAFAVAKAPEFRPRATPPVGTGAGDAFKLAAAGDAFKLPSAGDAFKLPSAGDAFKTPEAGDAFAVSTPVTPKATGAQARTLDELVARLSDPGLFSRDRETILAAHRDRVFLVRARVERMDRTFGFDLPDAMRDGRTLEGEVPGKGIKLHVRYPAARNAELDRLSTGAELDVQAVMVGWDDLFKRATMDAM